MNKVHPVQYYYKDLATGIEMNFSKTPGWGWAVSFPQDSMQFFTVVSLGITIPCITIPWPTLSEDEQAAVDENYRKLKELEFEGE